MNRQAHRNPTRTSKPTGNMNPRLLKPKDVRLLRWLVREYTWPLSWCSRAFGIAENPVVHILEGRSYKTVRREWEGPVPWEEIVARGEKREAKKGQKR